MIIFDNPIENVTFVEKITSCYMNWHKSLKQETYEKDY